MRRISGIMLVLKDNKKLEFDRLQVISYNSFLTGICTANEVEEDIMNIEYLNENGTMIAVVSSDEKIIVDTQSALDLAMTVKYETGAEKIILNKKAVVEEFFILSTGIAGEILQKFMNYHVKLAIYGDYSGYTSKPLRDFIYESNQGKDFFFVETKEDAIQKLLKIQ